MNYFVLPGLPGKTNFLRERLSRYVIIELVANGFKVTIDQVLGRRRDSDIIKARHLSIYFLYEKCRMNKTQVGKVFSMDHSSVINSLKQAKNLIDTDVKFKEVFDSVNCML